MKGDEPLEILREDDFLEAVYGAKSRVSRDAWVESVTQSADWIVNSDKLREKIMSAASVSKRH